MNYREKCMCYSYEKGGVKLFIDTESNDMREWLIKRVKGEEVKEGEEVRFRER